MYCLVPRTSFVTHSNLQDAVIVGYLVLLHSEMLLLIQLLLCLSQGIHYVRGDDLFYDLNTDPNEADTTQSLNVNNSDVFRNLVERSKYWSEHVVVNEDIDITYKKHMWKKNGGISSWLVDNSSTSTVVPDKYNFSGAPNIVFVLVDDWVRINLNKK
jgi:hypothetical protein